ncbi:MAG: proline racemase family protein [Thermomicrobiales bacterium]
MSGIRRIITTVDAHAAGEPLRLITSGVPRLHGATILERRAEMLAEHDDLRRVLMWEPRGHADMYGAILTPPVTDEADYGVLFMHNEGYSTMCGHGIIAVTTILLETGMHPAGGGSAAIAYDSPAGLIQARATLEGGRVTDVAFTNVPSFVFSDGVQVQTSYGDLTVQVVYGGAFYALAEAALAGLNVEPGRIDDLIEFGMQVKHAVEAQLDVRHPLEPDLRGIYGTIITGTPQSPEADGRNVTIFADGEVDRSPCGTGTAARLAWLHASEEVGVDRPWVHESITGTAFTGRVIETADIGELPAIVPEIAGRAYITGLHSFIVEPDDPLAGGFLVR